MPSHQPRTAGEVPFVQAHEPIQPRLQRGVLDGQLGPDHPVRLLHAQRVHRPNAEGFEPQILSSSHQGVEDGVLVVDTVVDFPTQFADEIEPQQLNWCQANGRVATGQPPESRVGKVGITHPAKQLARLRPGDYEHTRARRQIVEAH